MTESVLIALIAVVPLVIAQIAVLITSLRTHKLVNSKMTAALSKIESLEGEIRGLRATSAEKDGKKKATK